MLVNCYAYICHVDDCTCKMFCFSIYVLVQVAFQSSFDGFLPCDNWINTLKTTIACEKPNFSPNLKSQNKAMDFGFSRNLPCSLIPILKHNFTYLLFFEVEISVVLQSLVVIFLLLLPYLRVNLNDVQNWKIQVTYM